MSEVIFELNEDGGIERCTHMEIVRCRDCIHFRTDNPKTSAPSRCSGVFAFVHPDPDGFCAWGERR